MTKKVLIVSMTVLIAALGAAGVAVAGGTKYFFPTASPSSNVKPGTEITAKGSGALKSTAYYCVIAAYQDEKGASGNSAADDKTLTTVTSNSKGDITCKVKYEPFSAKVNGVTRHCPATAADKAAKYRCGVAFADKATIGALSEGVANFTPAN